MNFFVILATLMVAVTGGYSVSLAVDEIKKKRKLEESDETDATDVIETTDTIPESAAKSSATDQDLGSPSSATSTTSSEKKRRGIVDYSKEMFSRMRRRSMSPTSSNSEVPKKVSPNAYSGSPFKPWGEADTDESKSPMFP